MDKRKLFCEQQIRLVVDKQVLSRATSINRFDAPNLELKSHQLPGIDDKIVHRPKIINRVSFQHAYDHQRCVNHNEENHNV